VRFYAPVSDPIAVFQLFGAWRRSLLFPLHTGREERPSYVDPGPANAKRFVFCKPAFVLDIGFLFFFPPFSWMIVLWAWLSCQCPAQTAFLSPFPPCGDTFPPQISGLFFSFFRVFGCFFFLFLFFVCTRTSGSFKLTLAGVTWFCSRSGF